MQLLFRPSRPAMVPWCPGERSHCSTMIGLVTERVPSSSSCFSTMSPTHSAAIPAGVTVWRRSTTCGRDRRINAEGAHMTGQSVLWHLRGKQNYSLRLPKTIQWRFAKLRLRRFRRRQLLVAAVFTVSNIVLEIAKSRERLSPERLPYPMRTHSGVIHGLRKDDA